ncbi:hypothetical protein BDK51DRAFT_41283 [Blyttiomyces helicus]|uniref:UBA domain-containing protein n=1 Tax=Blyttiomyces helicus TaxID=388810 RepID=A0A4V1ISN9_9FUNG|nr:hypothetical protein BDK51DRAFT_41283 [Blyttiomyces helicus]|eukprot:RKO94217.1 hypothetical protein BDK51DRAFT_41283 [Blyttiomyces helicus]
MVSGSSNPIKALHPIASQITSNMSAKVVAKVSFNGTLRRIVINDTHIEWDAFLEQVGGNGLRLFVASIRKVHSFPVSIPVSVTHLDSDGDSILVDSTEELFEIVDSAIGTLRFDVVPAVRDDNAAELATSSGVDGGETHDSFVVVENPVQKEESDGKEVGNERAEQVAQAVEQAAEKAAEVAEHAKATLKQDAAVTDGETATVDDDTDPLDQQHSAAEKGKGPDAPSSPNSSSSASENPHASNDSTKTRDPIEEFVESIEPLFEALRAHVDANPEVFKNIEKLGEQIGEQAQAHVAPILAALEAEFAEARARTRAQHYAAHNRHPHPFAATSHPFFNLSTTFAPGRRYPANIPSPRCRFAPSPRPTNHSEILDALVGMGFTDRQANEDLLRRYGGNVESVVESLVCG